MDSSFFGSQIPPAQYAEWSLVTWFPVGVLDNESADRTIEFLEREEKTGDKPFHRFMDMTGYSRIRIGLDHVVRIARRRRRYAGPPVKSAFYAVQPVSLSIARLYAELMEGSRIQVCTFQDLAAAADWLGVPVALLRPSPPPSLQA